MPKKIDPQLSARCVRLVREHAQEDPTLTAAVAAVARQEGVSRESVRRRPSPESPTSQSGGREPGSNHRFRG